MFSSHLTSALTPTSSSSYQPQLTKFKSFILFLLCISICISTLTNAQPSTCLRESENKNEIPTFMCRYEISVIRESDCSITIRESMLLPHSFGKYQNRSFWIGTLQDVDEKNIRATFRDIPIPSDLVTLQKISGGTQCGQGKLRAPLIFASDTEVAVIVEINIINGVMKFTKLCHDDVQLDDNINLNDFNNILRWTSGLNNITDYDFFNITFTSALENSSLYLLNQSLSSNLSYDSTDQLSQGPTVWKSFTNFHNNSINEIELFVLENNLNSTPCNQSTWCIRRQYIDTSQRNTAAFFIIFVILLLSVFTLIALWVCAPCSKGKSPNNSPHQD